jgi:acetyl-CoA carboxylase biotin carboxyl carrier protein
MKKTKDFSESDEEATMAPKIDYEEINKIIKVLEDKNLAEFELEIEGFKIKISRGNPFVTAPAQPPAPNVAPSSVSSGNSSSLLPVEPQSPESPGNLHYITSPMVGLFYRAPTPSAPPFVEVGYPVTKKQTLCIVEAMKLMNEIESDVDGIVKHIFVENGKTVEFGQKMFAILPTA